jgi:hypothetical protein
VHRLLRGVMQHVHRHHSPEEFPLQIHIGQRYRRAILISKDVPPDGPTF